MGWHFLFSFKYFWVYSPFSMFSFNNILQAICNILYYTHIIHVYIHTVYLCICNIYVCIYINIYIYMCATTIKERVQGFESQQRKEEWFIYTYICVYITHRETYICIYVHIHIYIICVFYIWIYIICIKLFPFPLLSFKFLDSLSRCCIYMLSLYSVSCLHIFSGLTIFYWIIKCMFFHWEDYFSCSQYSLVACNSLPNHEVEASWSFSQKLSIAS